MLLKMRLNCHFLEPGYFATPSLFKYKWSSGNVQFGQPKEMCNFGDGLGTETRQMKGICSGFSVQIIFSFRYTFIIHT